MIQRALIGFLALAALLGATITLELTGRVADEGGMAASIPRPPIAPPVRAAPPPVEDEDRQALVDGILARPLFTATRRPAAAAPSAPAQAAAPANLPRLAGTMVNGPVRSAIFAASGGGRPVVVQEGAKVGGYTVQLIEAGQVTLGGPSGNQVLRLAFDARPPSAGGPGAAIGPGAANGPGSAAKGVAPFAMGTDVLQSLRGLPGFPGAAR